MALDSSLGLYLFQIK